jgi:hypothetical protein
MFRLKAVEPSALVWATQFWIRFLSKGNEGRQVTTSALGLVAAFAQSILRVLTYRLQ